MRRTLGILAIVLMLLGMLLIKPEWVAAVRQAFSVESISGAAAYLRSFGAWTPVISMLLMIVQAVIAPLPGSLITGANGIIFGIWWGALISWTGGLAGATASYWLSRWLGRHAVARWFGAAALRRVDVLGGPDGFWIVLAARLIPLISFDFISYLAGVSRIGYLRFMLATAIGMVPGTLAYSILGHDLALAQTSALRLSLVALFLVVAYLGGRWWLRRQRGRFDLRAE